MKNDLISRSALMNHLRENVFVDVTPALEQAVKDEPTAYDMDKVVERLEARLLKIKKQLIYAHDEDLAVRLKCKKHDLEEVLKIVKSGGIE